uniref:Nucleoporin Nup54 alpha-helical domain-containing protein n=1 Tax=Peronospora matthiolae TaxID=2874970 RepID=A0AAV1TR54_9STRA
MFGATASAPQTASSGFSFGSSAAAATPSSSGFNFGAAPAASGTGGGFGSSGTSMAPTATGSTGFNFGAPLTSMSTAPAASSGFSFGAAPATPSPASSGFSFGGTSTAPSTGGSSGFSFGGTAAPAAAAPAAAAPASSGFSFGGASATPSTGGGSGFGFGGTAVPAASSSGFNFGSTSTAPAATGSGFSFGGTAPATSSAPSFGTGANAATTAKPSFFGQQPAASSTATTGFGSGFSFGAKPATAGTGFGFGTGSGLATGSSTFGTTGTSLFGGGGGSGFGTATPGTVPSGFGVTPASTAPAPIILGADASVAQLNTIKAAYQDPAQSRFKFLMYNTVDPMQRHLYARPPYISERLWNQAELDNPDPPNCVPVPILGFDNLLKRIKVQQEHADKYNKHTDDLRAQLNELDKHTRATEEKLEKCRHEHVQLFHSLVKVMRDIELLQNYGKPLQREEMQLATMLKKLQTLLNSPDQYKARLKDVVSLQHVPNEAQPPPTSQLSPQDLQRLYELMDKQRQGMEHLTNIINDDLADIQLIKETWRR